MVELAKRQDNMFIIGIKCWLLYALLQRAYKLNCMYTGLDKQKNSRKIVNIFLPIIFSVCFGWSKEPSHWDGTFENPYHMFGLKNKKIIFLLRTFN